MVKTKILDLVMLIVIGSLLGLLFGLYLNEFTPDNTLSVFLSFAIPITFFGIMAYNKPVTTESIAYGLAIIVLISNLHDLATDDRTILRLYITGVAFVCLLVNIFSGRLKFGKFKKTLKKSVGI